MMEPTAHEPREVLSTTDASTRKVVAGCFDGFDDTSAMHTDITLEQISTTFMPAPQPQCNS